MMMIADMSGTDKPLEEVMADLDRIGAEIGVNIRVQREEIFTSMHRI